MVKRASLWAAALIALGCSGEPECGRLPACDIRDETCQRDVLAIAACARGDAPSVVPIRVMDFDAYVDEQIAEAAQTDPDERARRERLYAGLALLDLVPEGLTLEDAVERDVDWVGAFYSRVEREIVVLDRGGALDSPSATALLLHEIVHALQDAAHDFEALYDAQPLGRDGAVAVSALIEGEAVARTDRALSDAFGYNPGDVDWDDLYRRYGVRSGRTLASSDSPLFDVGAWFVYAFGARYVSAALEREGGAAVANLFASPPASARQIALGWDVREPDRGAWIEPELEAQALPPAPEGFALVGALHLGAYLAHLFAAGADARLASAPLAETASDRLRADVLTVQANDEDDLLVTWRLRFSEAQHAERFVAVVRSRATHGVFIDDRDAIVVAERGDDLIEPLLEPGAWLPLPDDDEAAASAGSAGARVSCMGLWP